MDARGLSTTLALCRAAKAQRRAEQRRDTKDKRRDSHENMTMVEFLEALCRIAWVHPRVSGESIREKLEGLLALLFEDAKKTQNNVISSIFGGKKGGSKGLASMFGRKK